MKRAFSIINLICIIASIIFVGLNFFSKVETGKDAYLAYANFNNSSEDSIIVSQLEDCDFIVDNRIVGLTEQQREYLYELSSVLERLSELTNSLSPKLLLDNSKTKSAKQLIESFDDLSIKRTNFLDETERFKIKISGNLYGDTFSSINIFIENFLEYLNDYNSTLQLLNAYLKEYNTATFNIIEFYGSALPYLKTNYQNLTFNSNAYQTIKELNVLIGLENSTNIITSTTSGIISTDANNFNYYYKLCNKQELIKKFYSTSINLSIDSNSNEITLCTYYFYKILGGVA